VDLISLQSDDAIADLIVLIHRHLDRTFVRGMAFDGIVASVDGRECDGRRNIWT
jgi:hypothetical protein